MSRFEDQFKNAFDHFEPEVDPKLWQQISQQLPTAPQAPAAAGSAGKGMLAQLGIKGIAAIIAAATLTILGVNYLLTKEGKEVQHNAPVSSTQEVVALEKEGEKVQPSSISLEKEAAELPILKNNNTDEKSTHTSNHPLTPDSKIATDNSLTGDLSKGKGESVQEKDSPAPPSVVKNGSVSTPKAGMNSSTEEAAANSAAISPSEKLVKPVLILSTKGGFAPLTVTALTNQPGNSKAVFDFGDGKSTTIGTTANTVYEEPGTYTVTCDINGEILEQKVTVFGEVPSAFSPNGDGINDFLILSKDPGITVEIRIFSRSGKLMFNGKGNNISWDGTFEGKNADAGTYLYDIFATAESGGTFKQKGTIHLFR